MYRFVISFYFSSSAVPGMPGVPEVTDVTATSCRLAWNAPDSDGGAPITDYIIERRSGMTWLPLKKTATTTSFEVTELTEGATYEFRIIAQNKVGKGKPGMPCQPFVAKNPFSKSKTWKIMSFLPQFSALFQILIMII